MTEDFKLDDLVYRQIKEAFEAKEKALKEKLEAMTEEERIAYYKQEKETWR